LKALYWLLAIAVTFVVGFFLGQQATTISPSAANTAVSSVVVNSHNTTEHKRENDLAQSSRVAGQTLTADTHKKEIASTYKEIDKLLVVLTTNPENKKAQLKLHILIDELSLAEVEALILTLERRSSAQRNILAQQIVASLLELAPRKVLSFVEQYNPAPDYRNYINFIKHQLVKKDAEIGFELFEQGVVNANNDTNLSDHFSTISILAKHDSARLLDLLMEYKNQGVGVTTTINLLSYGLETSDEFNTLFDQLRDFDDLTLFDLPMMGWLELSPDDVFDKLTSIENANDRQVLTKKAHSYWMMKDPQAAADKRLSSASNKQKELDEIMRGWPNEKAEQALIWLSQQEGIDNNSYKKELLENLTYSDPSFVQEHLADVTLADNEKAAFYHKIYNGLLQSSSNKAERFLDTLPNKSDVQALITEQSTPAPNAQRSYIESINKGFDRYFDYKEPKAFAIAIDDSGEFSWAYSVNRANQENANQIAIEACQEYRSKNSVTNQCKIYAEGDEKLFEL